MRRFAGMALAVGLAVLMTGSAAMAQGRGGRGGFGGFQMGPVQLLGMEPVQKELNLTDEQKAKIKEIGDSLRPAAGTNFQNMTDEQRREFFEEMRKKGEAAAKQAAEALTDAQNTRLKQIQLWLQGTRALTQNEELAKQLNVTDEQKEALKTITEESDKKGREIGRVFFNQNATDEERAKAREESAALRLETEAECLAVLTDDQKTQFEKLKGPKFEMDMSQFFGRGRRGGRPQ